MQKHPSAGMTRLFSKLQLISLRYGRVLFCYTNKGSPTSRDVTRPRDTCGQIGAGRAASVRRVLNFEIFLTTNMIGSILFAINSIRYIDHERRKIKIGSFQRVFLRVSLHTSKRKIEREREGTGGKKKVRAETRARNLQTFRINAVYIMT
ncbi:hypothetical protein PUN28_008590 [Cardiocondyla obscurior]|uniref:Uncharacterized protein n=1 Tax=Cardiocondyla obscurior TaxID=286306 RepID=A0AAW2G4C0_9HYME